MEVTILNILPEKEINVIKQPGFKPINNM